MDMTSDEAWVIVDPNGLVLNLHRGTKFTLHSRICDATFFYNPTVAQLWIEHVLKPLQYEYNN